MQIWVWAQLGPIHLWCLPPRLARRSVKYSGCPYHHSDCDCKVSSSYYWLMCIHMDSFPLLHSRLLVYLQQSELLRGKQNAFQVPLKFSFRGVRYQLQRCFLLSPTHSWPTNGGGSHNCERTLEILRRNKAFVEFCFKYAHQCCPCGGSILIVSVSFQLDLRGHRRRSQWHLIVRN